MNLRKTIRVFVLPALAAIGALSAAAQNPSASGSLSVQLQNGSGLQMVLYSDPSGVTLGNSGTASASLAFGNVSAYGALSTNVTRTNGTGSFTVSTPFDINVQVSGLGSPSYTLSGELSTALPTGVTLEVDSVTLSNTVSTPIQKAEPYGSNVSHTLSAVISTSASGSGGPPTGSTITTTINFVATAN